MDSPLDKAKKDNPRLGWKRRGGVEVPLSESEQWAMDTLPRGPLVAHLIHLHALFIMTNTIPAARQVFEFSLIEIARHTQLQPGDWDYTPPPLRKDQP